MRTIKRKSRKFFRYETPKTDFYNVTYLGASEATEEDPRPRRKKLGTKLIPFTRGSREMWGQAFRWAEGPQREANYLEFELVPPPRIPEILVPDIERN